MNPLLAAEASGEDPPGLVDPVVGLMFWTLLVFALTLLPLILVPSSRANVAGASSSTLNVQELIDDVLIRLEDRDLHDAVASHAVDVRAPNLHRRAVAMEAL